jgi:phospholipase/lecithinase/hemolysin
MWRTPGNSLRSSFSRPHLETLEERTVLSISPIGGLGQMVVFGDSLVDTGNASLASGGSFPSSALYSGGAGRFSNGPIWVDTLARYLGEPAVTPSLAGGLDYAFGGATVATTPAQPVPTLSQQIGQYLTGQGLPSGAAHLPAPNDLFVVDAGADDFLDTFTNPTGPVSPITSADTLVSSLNALAAYGARKFVVANLPALGETPFIQELNAFIPGLRAGANAWTSAFNSELAHDLQSLQTQNIGTTVVTVDFAGLFQKATSASNPFGFTDTTDPSGLIDPTTSVLLVGSPASGTQNFMFYDGVHPTTKTGQIIGVNAAADVYDALNVHNLAVTSAADPGELTVSDLADRTESLREMVNLSNAMTGTQTITFNLGAGVHEIDLNGSELPITQNVNIDGPSNGRLVINGEGESRIFDVSAGTNVSLANLTLVNGSAIQGGAISNAGSLTLTEVALLANTAQEGGGIYNTGSLLAVDSLFLANTAQGSSTLNAGGGLANVGQSATAELFGTSLIGNAALGGQTAEGGAVANLDGADLDLFASLVAGNLAVGKTGQGGGIYLGAGSESTILCSIVGGNFASTKGANVYSTPRR